MASSLGNVSGTVVSSAASAVVSALGTIASTVTGNLFAVAVGYGDVTGNVTATLFDAYVVAWGTTRVTRPLAAPSGSTLRRP